MTIPYSLSDAASYKAYFANLALKNKLLGVGTYLYGDVEVSESEAAEWKNKKLWAWPATHATGSQQNDNYYFNRQGTIWIGGPCTSEKFDDQDIWYFACEALMKQIVSRILSDFKDSELSIQFSSSTIQRSDMLLSSTKFIGCELIFTFHDPDNLEYDANQWNP